MTMIRALLTLIVLFVAAPVASAAEPTHPGVWAATFIQAPFGDKFPRLALWFDAHARRWDSGFLAILRPGIGVDLSKTVSLHGGYAFVPSFPATAAPHIEHRIWEQALFSGKASKAVGLQGRLRFEQRFPGWDTGVGLRVRALGRVGLTPEGWKGWGFAVNDEVFFGFNETSWGNVAGFDQNRAFAGLILPLANGGRTEIGYMNLAQNVGGALIDSHIVQVNVAFNAKIQLTDGD
jgi:hypothetical protein